MKYPAQENKRAMLLFEILLVVVIVGILAAIAIPNFTAMRARVKKDMCINNLRQIKLAKEQWAIENNKESADTPIAADLDTYIKDGTAAVMCPLDTANTFATSYTINNVATDPTCKIAPTDHKL